MSDQTLNIQKALDTTETTTGNFLTQDMIVAGIREYFEKRTPLWNQFRKEKVDSNAIVFKEQDGVPVASFGAELAALPAAQHATYSESAVSMKSIYSRGEVSGQLIASSKGYSQGYADALDREIRNHTLGMVNTLENTLVVGDSAARPQEFDGLVKWITNTVDAGTINGRSAPADLILSDLEYLQDSTTTGYFDMYIMDAASRRRLWAVLLPQIRFVDKATIDGGFQVPTYNGLPIIEVKPHTQAARDAMEGVILGVNKEKVWLPVLQDITYEELAHTRDSTDFIIKMYLAMVVEGGSAFHAKLTNFTTGV